MINIHKMRYMPYIVLGNLDNNTEECNVIYVVKRLLTRDERRSLQKEVNDIVGVPVPIATLSGHYHRLTYRKGVGTRASTAPYTTYGFDFFRWYIPSNYASHTDVDNALKLPLAVHYD